MSIRPVRPNPTIRTSVVAIVSVAFAMAVGVSGCAASNLDMAPLKRAISDKIGEVEIKVKSIECPAERKVTKGDRFQCTAVTDNDVRVPVDVQQVDDSGGVSFNVGKQVYSTAKVVPEIENGFKGTGASVVSVACPKGIAIADGNGTLTCTAKADDVNYTVTIPVKDGVAQFVDEAITQV